MKCERCGGILSMSATSGGTTWWRCTVCSYMHAAMATPPPPPMPAVASSANPARFASGAAPPYPERVSSAVVRQAGAPVTSTPAPNASDTRDAASHAPESSGLAAPPEPNGCGVCGSNDVQYVLETDVGVDAATLANGQVIRVAFCSVECLAEKLGLVPAASGGP